MDIKLDVDFNIEEQGDIIVLLHLLLQTKELWDKAGIRDYNEMGKLFKELSQKSIESANNLIKENRQHEEWRMND